MHKVIICTPKFRSILRQFVNTNRLAKFLYNGKIPSEISNDNSPQFISTSKDLNRLTYVGKKKLKSILSKDPELKNVNFDDMYNERIYNYDTSYLKIKLKPRVNSKIGSTLNKIFKDVKPSEIEDFVNSYKSFYYNEMKSMKVVNGENVRRLYYGGKHHSSSGPLGISCMRHDRCQNYFKLYTHNKEIFSLLVLMSDEGLVKARALLWNLGKENGLDNDFKFMDRVYYSEDSQIPLFIKWAKENGYNYKEKMSWGSLNILN